MNAMKVKQLVLVLVTALVGLNAQAQSRDERGAREAIDLDGSRQCLERDIGWIFDTTGPCDSAQVPAHLRLGDVIEVNEKPFMITYIGATQVREDMPETGLKRGQWTCIALEDPLAHPDSVDNEGAWIYIKNCRPIQLLLPRPKEEAR